MKKKLITNLIITKDTKNTDENERKEKYRKNYN